MIHYFMKNKKFLNKSFFILNFVINLLLQNFNNQIILYNFACKKTKN